MAVFSQITADKEVADYLYELNQNLTYMFNNLTPEDNYSEKARLIYAQRGKQIASLEVRADAIELRVSEDETKIATLEVRADAIELKVQNNETNYNTSIRLLADLLTLSATTPEGTSSVKLTGDKIELKTGKFIVNAKNLTIDALGNAVFSGKVTAAQIESSAITGGTITGSSVSAGTIDGTTITGGTISGTSMSASTITGGTINSTTLNSSTINSSSIFAATISGGSITGTSISGGSLSGATITGNTISGGSISGATITGNTISGGTIDGTTISGGTINGTTINGGDSIRFKARPGYLQFGDFEVDDTYGRHIFQSYDEVTGMSTGDISSGEMLLWAGWNGTTATFRVFEDEVRIRGDFYINGVPLDDYILSVVGDNGSGDDSGDDSGSSPGGTPSGGDSGGPTGDETDPILGGG
jgi:uncharacterized protein YjbI with pentapeptide repeats